MPFAAMSSASIASSNEAFPLLRVDNLSVSFASNGKSIEVVRGISFEVKAGRTLCLVGESGCGKSMTALALLRLLPEQGRLSGRICFEGEDLSTLRESALHRIRGSQISMVFQEPMTSLNPVLRIGEQVAEPLRQHLRLSRNEVRQQTIALLEQVGIPAPELRLRDYPHQLSGGMRQRVMIAMALACKPRLLLADEPTTALDVTIQGQILAVLRELTSQNGMGLLLITHDLGVVAEMADDVGVMYAGTLVEQAPVRTLFAAPVHPYTLGLMHSAPSIENLSTFREARLQAIPGVVPAPGNLPEGCPFRPRCPQAHERCGRVPPLVRLDPAGHQTRCWLAADKFA